MDDGRADAIAALADGRPALIWRRQIADTETPVAAALKLIEPGRGDFLLESVEGGETRGRHSLIGLAPDLVFRAEGNTASINPHWLTDRNAFSPCAKPTLDALRDLVGTCRMDVPAELPRALACLVGYFGYETIGLVERLHTPIARCTGFAGYDVRAANGHPDLRPPGRRPVLRRTGLAWTQSAQPKRLSLMPRTGSPQRRPALPPLVCPRPSVRQTLIRLP